MYCGQWDLFPKPVDTSKTEDADVVLISHGHEDHLHADSLRQLLKDARVFYPYSWHGGARQFLGNLGFAHCQEAATGRTYRLVERTQVTFIANNLDSIIVIEHDGQVFVNANDALHSYPAATIDYYVERIARRWGRIDGLFCGYGGANYFPNTIHCPGKDDVETGRVREQLFVNNFCRIVDGLKPQVAVPFAADFVLLDPRQRWINDVKMPRSRLGEYYRQYFEKEGGERFDADIIAMYPGDVLEETIWSKNSMQPKSKRLSSQR